MFRDTRAFSGFAVPDTDAARDFYGGTLGLEVTEENGLLTLHVAGDRPILVYPKPDHEPATYTILNFPVADVDRAVDEPDRRRRPVRGLRRRRPEDGRAGRLPRRGADDRLVPRPGGEHPLGARDPGGRRLAA